MSRLLPASIRFPVRRGLALACALGLAACSTTPSHAPGLVFDDADFAPSSEHIDAGAVFALSPQMLAYIDSNITAEQRSKGRQRGLLFGLFATEDPFLAYDASMTRTASEAFAARSGNCLSLVLMTSAFARRLGLGVRYQWIDTRNAWSRGESLDYLNTHVNIVLLPPNDAQGEGDRAYWWAKAAIGEDPGFGDAVNTLAVIYKARGLLSQDEQALRWLLDQEPDNIVALQNLQRVLEAQGRAQEAGQVAERVRQLLPVAPFHYYELGQVALEHGQYLSAKQLFQKELRRDAHYDKFHASLALAHYGLGELGKARAEMALALERSTTSADRAMYARMLAHLRAGEHP